MARNDAYYDHDRDNTTDTARVQRTEDGRYRGDDGRFYEAMPATADRGMARGYDQDRDTDRDANKKAAKTGITTFLLGLLTGALLTLLLTSLLNFNVTTNQQTVPVPNPNVEVEGVR